MKHVKKSYGWLVYRAALLVVTFCGAFHCASPAWAEEVVNQGASQEAVQALNKKIDILIDTLSASGQVHFTDAIKEELGKLNQQISPPPQQAALDAPRQAALDAPRQAALDAPRQAALDAPRQAALDAPRQAALDAPRQAALDAPRQAALDAPRQAALDAPRQAALDAPRQAALDAPASPSWFDTWVKQK